MMSSINTKSSYILLTAIIVFSAVGMADSVPCGCDHSPRELEMPSISDPVCCATCCETDEHDDGCCCTLKDRDAEPRSEGFLPRSNLNDVVAPVTQTLPESMPRIAAGKNRCVDPKLTIERLPPHLCTTVLLI
jgi:hypothetical protein